MVWLLRPNSKLFGCYKNWRGLLQKTFRKCNPAPRGSMGSAPPVQSPLALKVQIMQLSQELVTEVKWDPYRRPTDCEGTQTCQTFTPGGASVIRIKPRIWGRCSQTRFPPPGTDQRCLMAQQRWDKLGLPNSLHSPTPEKDRYPP